MQIREEYNEYIVNTWVGKIKKYWIIMQGEKDLSPNDLAKTLVITNEIV